MPATTFAAGTGNTSLVGVADGNGSSQSRVAWQIAVTLVVVAAMFGAMAKEFGSPDMLMMTALTIFVAVGIISVEESVQGFSNTGMMTVAALLVVAEAVKRTDAIAPIRQILLVGQNRPLSLALAKIMAPVTLLSGFMNNTPVVAMLIPVLVEFSSKEQLKPSKPVSFGLLSPCTFDEVHNSKGPYDSNN
jgi:Na+/H+ antiporter NhaD/arsenite permease-like protein